MDISSCKMHLLQILKSLVFHLITVEKSKVSLETQSVNFNPLKIKKSNYVLPTYNGTHPHPQREESEYSEEMLSQSVTNPAGQTPNAAAPCPRSKGANGSPPSDMRPGVPLLLVYTPLGRCLMVLASPTPEVPPTTQASFSQPPNRPLRAFFPH